MGNIREEKRPNFVGDLLEGRPVEGPRVCRGADDDHLWTVGAGYVTHLVKVDEFGLGIDPVGDELVELGAEVSMSGTVLTISGCGGGYLGLLFFFFCERERWYCVFS